MQLIPLTQAKFAIVDDENYEKVNKFKWYYLSKGHRKTGYAGRMSSRKNGKREMIYMHRFILETPKNKQIDHINYDGLDNRKVNLRLCSFSENMIHREPYPNNRSGFKGVYWDSRAKRWRSAIRIDNQRIYLGFYRNIKDAAASYNKAAIKYFGNFAYLNFQGRTPSNPKH